jgi:endonuclease YncB( thermonuclease family)
MLRFFLAVLFGTRRKSSSYRHKRYSSRSFSNSIAYKKKAQSAEIIKEQIHDLPRVNVAWVVDGDTVVVKARGDITIRLDSIDCPEDGQYWGDNAKYGLMKMISKRYVYVEEHGSDGYGRTLATLYVWHEQKGEWLNVNERMVMLGHAWVMQEFFDHLPQDRQDNLCKLQNWARSKKVGLWHQENPVPPWQWRKG